MTPKKKKTNGKTNRIKDAVDVFPDGWEDPPVEPNQMGPKQIRLENLSNDELDKQYGRLCRQKNQMELQFRRLQQVISQIDQILFSRQQAQQGKK